MQSLGCRRVATTNLSDQVVRVNFEGCFSDRVTAYLLYNGSASCFQLQA